MKLIGDAEKDNEAAVKATGIVRAIEDSKKSPDQQ